MRNAIAVLVLVMVAAIAVPAVQAQPPIDGTWKTTNGDFLEGRESTSWSAPGALHPALGGRLQPGNTFNAASWNGGTLGTEWAISCPFIVNVIPIFPNVVNGNGFDIYQIIYAGGTITLDGSGPWGGGDPSYTGIITTYIETRTVNYVNYQVVGANSTHSIDADIIGYTDDCVTFGIGNGAWIGDTDGGPKPAGYPAFIDNACTATPTLGRWGLTTNMTLTVKGCLVPVENKSWGSIKSMYTE